MIIFEKITKLKKIPSCSLTIGLFDGVHQGHIHLIEELKKRKKPTVVVTFINHPLAVLKPKSPITLIYDNEKKIKLFKEHGIDYVYSLSFTKALANISFDTFLIILKKYIPFSHLVLGEDSYFGKDKKGTQENIKKMEDDLNFKAEYITKLMHQNQTISSTLIRKYIKEEKLSLAEKLLGRKLLHEDLICQTSLAE